MIDWERVRALRTEIGKEDFDEVVALFFAEASDSLARLSPRNGAEALSSDLHALKGAALNLGFVQLVALCQDGETRAAAGDTGVDLDAVRDAYEQARRAFEAGATDAFAA